MPKGQERETLKTSQSQSPDSIKDARAIQDTKNVSVMTSTKNIKTANAALAGNMIIPVNQVNIARTANANQNAEIMYANPGKAMTAAQQIASLKRATKIIALL